MTDETDPLFAAQTWLENGHKAALATVISTWGSAPRPAGSVMAVREDGAFAGSVSAGCVEAAVMEAARTALANGKHRRLSYGVADSTAWSAGLTCGGNIEILVEPLTISDARETLTALNSARHSGRPVVRAVELDSGAHRLIDPQQDSSPLTAAAAEAAARDRSGEMVVGGTSWFLTVFNSPIDLVVIGAVHIAQALVRMAQPLGYAVRVIDPRASFATPERFAGVALVHGYLDEALVSTPLHRRSAIVALAHDAKIDDPALVIALASPAFYVGALGSPKTQRARHERLLSLGVSQRDLARLHGPVGLPIGSKSPEEIAISILADIIATLRNAPAIGRTS